MEIPRGGCVWKLRYEILSDEIKYGAGLKFEWQLEILIQEIKNSQPT